MIKIYICQTCQGETKKLTLNNKQVIVNCEHCGESDKISEKTTTQFQTNKTFKNLTKQKLKDKLDNTIKTSIQQEYKINEN